jgi:hypothetical protein
MAATVVSPALASGLLKEEWVRYWEQLVNECKMQITAINTTLTKNGKKPADCVECYVGQDLHLRRSHYPSTEIRATLNSEHWGTAIHVRITGQQTPQFSFYTHECQLPLAKDLNDQAVAIYDEGRSLDPRELASFLTQHFRRCFPRIPLPCPQ